MDSNLRIFISAGEASGDLHAGELARAILDRSVNCEITGLGGDGMQSAGVELLRHVNELAVMGIAEVFGKLLFFRKVLSECRRHLARKRPDLVILVDYPDFNLRLAASAKRLGLPVMYFISPQIWAWRKGRIKQIARNVDRMVVIFPFEEDFYRKAGVAADFVGHPLVDHMQFDDDPTAIYKSSGINRDRRLLGIFPGSRKQEIERIGPIMRETADLVAGEFPDIVPVVGVAPTIDTELARNVFATGRSPFRFVQDRTHDLMRHSVFNLVASGTATVEAAVAGTPFAIVYVTSWFTYAVVRRLVDVPYIGMANLIAGRRVAEEFIQGQAQPQAIARTVVEILKDTDRYRHRKTELSRFRRLLGKPGAIERAAGIAIRMASSSSNQPSRQN